MDQNSTAVNTRRRYDSSGRQERARQTRDQITDIARELFLSGGYADTTVAAIAAAARVSVETIYKGFGGKPGLVRAIVERVLAGEGPIPAEQRSDRIRDTEPDPRKILTAWGAFTAELAPRAAPILLLARDAAAGDPEVTATLEQISAARLERMTVNAHGLLKAGHLRPGLTADQAADIMWAYSSPELYELLVIRREWPPERYGQFVAQALIAALLPAVLDLGEVLTLQVSGHFALLGNTGAIKDSLDSSWCRGGSQLLYLARQGRGGTLTVKGGVSCALTGEIVGREIALAACERLLERAAEGPAALVVEGEAGIGKTTVWRAGVAAAAGRGFAVLACRPAEAEARLSYSGLGDLLRPLAASVLPQLPEPQRFALEAALLERDGGGRPPDRRTVSVGVLTALRAIAAAGPVLLAVDDVQWLDAPTRRMLEYALRRVREERLAVLVSVRTGAGAAGLPLELETLADSRRELVRLGPLSLAALHRLLGSRLGLSPPRPALVRIHHAAAGNPFYALEVGRLLGDGDTLLQGRLPVPEQVKELLAARLHRLPAATQEALLAAACLSRPSLELLDVEALASAEQAGIVSVLAGGHVRFTHPLFASAVYHGASAARRRRVHLRMAERVNSIEEHARHLALGTTGRDDRVAGEVRAGARRALARGAPEAAAELYEQAQRLSHQRQEQLACAIAAAECHLRAGDMSVARDLLAGAVAELPAGLLGARALWRLADVDLYQDDFPGALGLLERARTQAGEGELAAEIELDLAFARNAVGDMPAADPHAQEAVRLAGRLERPGLLAEALAVASITGFLLGRRVDWERLERALALEDWERPSVIMVRPSYIAALLYSWTGDLARGRSMFGELRRQLLDRGDESGLVMGSMFRIPLDCWRGDIGGACRLADELCEHAALLGGEAAQAVALAAASMAHAYAGDEALVRSEAAEALALFARVGWAVGRAWPVTALGMLELSLGNPAAAERVLSPLTEFMRQAGLAEPWGPAPFLPDAVEALVRLGRLEEAQALLAELEASAARADRAAALAAASRCRALLLAEHGDAEAAWNAIERALQQHDRVPMPIERARTLLVKGQLERRARHWHAAQDSVQQALAIFEQAGAGAWAGQARTELDRVRLHHRPKGELTESERRVAGLAATGLTNREVAAQLFMSPKTVEANLARAYRKLGIHSRAELGALIGAERAPARR